MLIFVRHLLSENRLILTVKHFLIIPFVLLMYRHRLLCRLLSSKISGAEKLISNDATTYQRPTNDDRDKKRKESAA